MKVVSQTKIPKSNSWTISAMHLLNCTDKKFQVNICFRDKNFFDLFAKFHTISVIFLAAFISRSKHFSWRVSAVLTSGNLGLEDKMKPKLTPLCKLKRPFLLISAMQVLNMAKHYLSEINISYSFLRNYLFLSKQ